MGTMQRVTIYIDKHPHPAESRRYTGAQLRALLSPPANDLYLDVDDAQDRFVPPDAVISLTEGMHFFTSLVVTIYLDAVPYTVPIGTVSEEQLRALPSSALRPEFELFLDIPDALDRRLSRGELLEVRGGERFFSKRKNVTRKVTIIINATPHTVHAGVISFDELVALAYPVPPGPDPEYQVSYHNGDPRHPEGTLLESQSVDIREGMIFNVTGTDKS